MVKRLMPRETDVLVAFKPDGSGGGTCVVYGDPFSEEPQLPVTILVNRWDTTFDVFRLIRDVCVAWGVVNSV